MYYWLLLLCVCAQFGKASIGQIMSGIHIFGRKCLETFTLKFHVFIEIYALKSHQKWQNALKNVNKNKYKHRLIVRNSIKVGV